MVVPEGTPLDCSSRVPPRRGVHEHNQPLGGLIDPVAVADGCGACGTDALGTGALVASGAFTVGVVVSAGCDGRAGGVVSGLRVGVVLGVGRFGGAAGGVSHSFSRHEGVGVGVFDGVGVGVVLGVSDGVGVGVEGGVVLVLGEGDGVVFGGLHLPSLSRPLSSTHGGVSTTSRGGVLFGDFGLRGTPLSHWNPHSRRKRQVLPSLVWTVSTLYASGRGTSSGVTRGMPSSPISM